MWNTVNNEQELAKFMNKVSNFHDSCIKEVKYLSGAYVDARLEMYPINECRMLSVIIQRQFSDISMIEMLFEGLKHLRLSPVDDQYTCEILDATMFFKDDYIYWYDSGSLSEAELENYSGTMICAEKFRWRPIENEMGEKEFYKSRQ